MQKQPWGMLLSGLLMVALTGCGSESDDAESAQERQVYLGDVADTNVMAALVIQDGTPKLYTCGKDDTLNSHTRWFTGELTEGSALLGSDDWSATLAISDSEASGSLVAPDGQSLSLNLQPAALNTMSDLWSTLDSGCRTGVIVIDAEDGSDANIRGAWCNDLGVIKQVTPVLPIDITDEGLMVSVEFDEGPQSFRVQRMVLP